MKSHELEMSFPDSQYFPSKRRQVGAILVAGAAKDLRTHGVFWRYGDYLVTARHVADGISSGDYQPYFTDMIQNKRGNWFINKRKCIKPPRNFFAPDDNIIKMTTVDLFVKKMDWTGLSIQKSSLKTRSAYGLTVNSVGYVDELLVTAIGSTKKSRVLHEIAHTASTSPGFSGSPLFCGNSVVGVHVRNENKENVAVRAEILVYLVRKSQEESRDFQLESGDFEENELREFNRMEGREVEIESIYDIDDDVIWRSKSDGRIGFAPKHRAKFGQAELKGKPWADYDDEIEEESANQAYEVIDRKQPVHVPMRSKTTHMALQALDMDRARQLGYEEGLFEYPEVTVETERLSVKKHLELFHDRCKSITRSLTEGQTRRVVNIVTDMLSPLKFMPKNDYDSEENIASIINSSRVKDHKSAGHPWVSENRWPLNVDVLENIPNFHLEVLKRWHDAPELKVQIKNESTKIKKIKAKMPRVVMGFPNHKLVQNAAVFGSLLDTLPDNWRDTPVKYFWTPAEPGSISHLDEWLGPETKYDSDKTNWDYMCHKWLVDIVRSVIKRLVVRPLAWSDERFDKYLNDVDLCFQQAFETRLIRLSNGEIIKPTHDGIMPSGWLLTILVNTLCMVAGDVAVKVAMGVPTEVIKRNRMVAGGDDVIQTMEGVDVDTYEAVSAEMGFECKLTPHETLDGVEFFSCKMYRDDSGWKYKPVRFTRHIEHLLHQKDEELASHLTNLMLDWRWDASVFNLLRDTYLKAREMQPGLFPLSRLPDLGQLQDQAMGYE